MRHRIMLLCTITLLIGTSCTGTAPVVRGADQTGDPAIGMLGKRIVQLTVNVNGLSKRLSDVPPLPADADATVRELRELDLLGWQLHQKQWVLQRDYLVFARDQLERAQRTPGDKSRLLNEWRQRRDEYATALATIRQQRHDLEQRHADAEARLIEQRFQ